MLFSLFHLPSGVVRLECETPPESVICPMVSFMGIERMHVPDCCHASIACCPFREACLMQQPVLLNGGRSFHRTVDKPMSAVVWTWQRPYLGLLCLMMQGNANPRSLADVGVLARRSAGAPASWDSPFSTLWNRSRRERRDRIVVF